MRESVPSAEIIQAEQVSLDTAPTTTAPQPERRFLGFLRKPDTPPALPVVAAAETDTTVLETETKVAVLTPEVETPPPGPSMTDEEIAAAGNTGAAFPEPSRKPRLFGFLKKRVPGEVTAPDAPVVVAAAPALAAEEPVARRGGLFAPRDTKETPDTTLAAFAPPPTQTTKGPVVGLPFGQIVKVCGVAPRSLGTEVARSEGAGTYRLYDSNPSSIAIRPQFITGFKDKCARQFNAALALFGTSAVHEAMRYNPLNTNPYSETDNAYETVKVRLCGVRRGKACPDNKTSKLAKKAAFVSVYRGFGSSGDWLEMFLHNGEVIAYAARTN